METLAQTKIYDEEATKLLKHRISFPNVKCEDIAEYLALGADPNAIVSLFDTNLLHWALMNKRADLAELVLSYHPKLDARTMDGSTALHAAVNANMPSCVKLLLKAGAEVDAVPNNGVSALGMVKQNQWNADIAQALLDAGADLELRDCENKTPLMRAMEQGNEEAALFFVEAGADVLVCDEQGLSIVHQCGWYEMFELQADLFKLGFYIDPRCRTLTWPAGQWEKAQNTWQEWQNQGAPVGALQGWMLARFGNIGKLNEAINPARWRGHEQELLQLLDDTHPYLQRQIAKAHPELMAMLTTPQPVIESWGAKLAAREVAYGR